MRRWIFGRVIQALISIWVASVVVFGVVRLTGDPVAIMMPAEASEQDVAAMRSYLKLDRPWVVQYWYFLSRAFGGDFGRSLRFQRPAFDVVMERYPATIKLGALATLIAILVAIPVGVYAAAERGSWLDAVSRAIAGLGQSVPTFWLGLVLILVFGVIFRVLPTSGAGSAAHYVLPAVTLGWWAVAGLMRLTRSAMLDVLGMDYIKLARLKGLPEYRVIWKHAFKNAALPVLTFAAVLFVFMLNGAIVVETVFNWPGIGRLLIEAVQYRDYPVVQTIVIILSAMYVGANLLVDIIYAYLNPKISYS